MYRFSLGFLQCVRCANRLELEVISEKGGEVEEGFLVCTACSHRYPIISKIPVLWDSFALYLASRPSLGGWLYSEMSHSDSMRSFVKESLSQIGSKVSDRTRLERRWVRVYEKSRDSLFYSKVRGAVDKLPKCDVAIDNGCSIGILTNYLAKQRLGGTVLGTDVSFFAVRQAKLDSASDNVDYFVSDLLCSPLDNSQGFGLVVALNLLELVEPTDLLNVLSLQTAGGGYLVLSDPYDYERGINTVRNPLDAESLRENLAQLGFEVTGDTVAPSFIRWDLVLGPRAKLEYDVDLVVAKKVGGVC